jgi:hypothetical protein
VERLADGKVVVDIHRRKKRRVVDKPTSKLRSSLKQSNEIFAQSEQLDRSNEWRCITSRNHDGNMPQPHEGDSLPHDKADGDLRLSMRKKKRKSWDYRYKELLEFKDKVRHGHGIARFCRKNVNLTLLQYLNGSMDTAKYPKRNLH